MKVYIVTADTYIGSWGTDINLFLVTESKEDAEKEAAQIVENGWYPEITEVTLNEATRKYLGGYIE
ncbi:hypothetical protein [uncultured Vagococcus sp.]|uniref:DUF7336 domain-containing protein n=1 Tax=uncultured Vagococcus sp. TaxID=189676 RepID=UPI0025897C83|nr:hypothetical protein [uncultured Vagococcus sp.]